MEPIADVNLITPVMGYRAMSPIITPVMETITPTAMTRHHASDGVITSVMETHHNDTSHHASAPRHARVRDSSRMMPRHARDGDPSRRR
jgi:hypothetical protein